MGAAWNQSIRGGQGHCRGGRRGRLFKEQNEKSPGEERSQRTALGPRDNSLAAAAKRIPARGLALLFIRVYSHSSVCIPGKKKVEPGNKNFFLSVFKCMLGAGGDVQNF